MRVLFIHFPSSFIFFAVPIRELHHDQELQPPKEFIIIHISFMQQHRRLEMLFVSKQKAMLSLKEYSEHFPTISG